MDTHGSLPRGTILVVAAHPDDEVLGCGGTIAKLTDSGATVRVGLMADGVSSRQGGSNAEELECRRAAGRKACQILGVESVFFGDLPDNKLDSVPLLDVTQRVEDLVEEFRPDTIFTHHGGDLNIDHRVVHQAVVTACRPQKEHPVRTLLFFEVPSSTEWRMPGDTPSFEPNWFVEIEAGLDRKLRALDAYQAEMRPWPHPRSREGVEHLARWRGATVGAAAAEAFMLGRRLV